MVTIRTGPLRSVLTVFTVPRVASMLPNSFWGVNISGSLLPQMHPPHPSLQTSALSPHTLDIIRFPSYSTSELSYLWEGLHDLGARRRLSIRIFKNLHRSALCCLH